MGDIVSSEQGEDFPSRIDYFEAAEDANYGRVEVYRLRQAPFEYVLDHRKTFIEDQERLSAYVAQGRHMAALEHKNLAKTHAVLVREDKQLCIIHRVVHTYANYYNFTLAQAIAKKKATHHSFSEGDLLYLMHSLLDALTFLQTHRLAFGNFRTQSVYLSPEGHLKLYLLGVDPQHKHTAFHRVLAEQTKLGEYLLAPEQLQAVRKMEYEGRFSVFKADLFAVGMVMVELITLDSASFYYNERLEVMLGKALFALDVHQGRYSQGLLQAIRSCLAADPQERPEPETVLGWLQEMRAESKDGKGNVYCIRLEAEENKKKEEAVGKPKGQFILNSLAKKLNPSPISTISSSSASLFRSTEPKSSSFRARSTLNPLSKE